MRRMSNFIFGPFLRNQNDNARVFSKAVAPDVKKQYKMASWQIHSYGNLEEVQLTHQARIPHITDPNEVLVKVHATSVNPIDIAMINGYGSTALNIMRGTDNIEFPLTMGRDFSGSIVSKGLGRNNDIEIGTSVWGVVPVHMQGCHAEYVIVDRKMVSPIPKNLSMAEAASMLYTGLTAYSGLKWSAGLNMHQMSGLKALVLGASGGVGNSVVQLLHAGNAKITATCARDAVELVESLGADVVLDYTDPNFEHNILDNGRYDLIIDCAGLGTDYAISRPWDFGTYVTFTTPILKNLDTQGLFRGTLTSIADIVCPNIDALKKGRIIKWAYFVPTGDGIEHISNLVISNKIKPNIEKIYPFLETPVAYDRLKSGHLRGKIVIDVTA